MSPGLGLADLGEGRRVRRRQRPSAAPGLALAMLWGSALWESAAPATWLCPPPIVRAAPWAQGPSLQPIRFLCQRLLSGCGATPEGMTSAVCLTGVWRTPSVWL